jgi:hypothetical protein
MSLAERKASEINAALAQRAADRQWILMCNVVAETASPPLFNALIAIISEEVAKFSKSVSEAATMSVQTDGGDTVKIQTTLFPRVDLQLNRVADGLNTKYSIQHDSMGRCEGGKWTLYRFAIDTDMKPCFGDAEAELTPEHLAAILLEPIFDVFCPR